MAPFPTDRLSKGLNLAPLSGVESNEFTLTPSRAAGAFVRPNYAPQKNFAAWGNQTKNGGPGFFGETGTKVLRIWADWYALQLNQPYEFNDPCLQALDRNIQAARNPGAGQDSLTIILTIRGFPAWTTGFGMRHPQTNRWVMFDDDNSAEARAAFVGSFPAGDPQTRAARIFDAAHTDRGVGRTGLALSQLRWPGSYEDAAADGVSTNGSNARTDLLQAGSPWYRFVELLARRYHPDPAVRGQLPAGYPTGPSAEYPAFDPSRAAPPALPVSDNVFIDVLEVVNEPNIEIWPQTNPSGSYQIAPRMTAEMIRSTKAIESAVNGSGAKLYFAAPATSDGWYRQGFHKASSPRPAREYETRFRSSYDQFIKRIAISLKANFDAGENFIFSHHNYRDIEFRRRGSPGRRSAGATTNGAAWVLQFMRGRSVLVRSGSGRNRVTFRWRGWPTSTGARLILTEGGAREGEYDADKGSQSDHLRRAFQYVRDSATRASGSKDGSYGIVLFANFLTWKDPGRTNPSQPMGATAKCDLVDYVSINGAAKMPPGFYPAGTREPNAAEYAAAERPVYDTWDNLNERR